MKIKEWIEEHPVVAAAAATGLVIGGFGGCCLTRRHYKRRYLNTTTIGFDKKFVESLAKDRGWSVKYARSMIHNTSYLDFLVGHEAQMQGLVNAEFVRKIAEQHGMPNYILLAKE